MRRLGRPPLRGTAGQTLPLLTLFMVVLLGFAGMVVDVGHAYVLKRKLQASVDMAVLSGARNLPDSASADTDLLARNYDGLPEPDAVPSACPSPPAGTVCVRADTDVETTFLRLFDIDDLDIAAQATAGISTYVGFTNVAPWAVTRAHYDAGTGFTSDFHLRGRSDYGHPSLRGTISIRSGPGCSWSNGVDERRILNGDRPVCEIAVAGVSDTETVAETIADDDGNSNGHLQGLEDRRARNPCNATCLAEFTEEAPGGRLRLTDDTHPNAILIPIINTWDRRDEMPVVGFVWFAITTWGGPDVHGRFLEAPDVMRAGMRCGSSPCSEGAYQEGSPGGKIIRLID